MRIRLTLGWILILSLMAAIGYAQAPAPQRLALAEALDIARRNNPEYLATMNDQWAADRQVRSANLNLLTPNVRVSGSAYTSQGGDQNFFGTTVRTPGLTRASYSLGIDYQLSGSSFTDRGLARAQVNATEQDIAGARTTLETGVRQQYLGVLQARAQEELAQQSLVRATENLNLAQARNSVGQATLIDVRRAEVEKGQAEVGVLRARQNSEVETLRLFQRLGVPAPEPVAVTLTDSFPVVAPEWNQQTLIELALAENPALRATRARAESAHWSVRAANSRYLPTLSMSAGYGRYSSRQDTVTTSGTNPWNLSVGLSLPLYDGFQRSVQTASARAQEDDMRLAIRRVELLVRADVTAAHSTLVQSYRTIAIQQSNRSASDEALELATQRYRVGSGSYIELLDARVAAERAAADYITAVYDYHRAIAALENAVGRPLR